MPKINPLIAAIAACRRTAENLTLALALPVEGESIGQRRSAAAKHAANSRWRHGRGA